MNLWPRRIIGVLFTCIIAIGVAGTSPAMAHGDNGEVTLTISQLANPTRMHIEAGVVYEGDGHLATDATVTATAQNDSQTLGPIVLTSTGPNSSLFVGDIDGVTPGEWLVMVDSKNPAAVASQTYMVTAPSTTTTPAPDVSIPETPDESAPVTLGATSERSDDDSNDVDAANREADNSSTGLVLALGIIIVVLIAVVAVLLGRRSSARSHGSNDSTPSDDDNIAAKK